MDDIIKHFSGVLKSNNLPSYVRIFLPEIPEEVHFLFKTSGLKEVDTPSNDESFNHNQLSSPEFDVTGSPLKCTMFSLRLDDTNVVAKEFWSEDESLHSGISLKEARTILSKYLCSISACNIPLWIVCDGLDVSKTLLLCAFKRDRCWSRDIVHFKGKCSLSSLKFQDDIVRALSSTSEAALDVNCTFDLCGYESFGSPLNNTTGNFPWSPFRKCLAILTWHHPFLEVPSKGVTVLLDTELEIGCSSSKIFPLWSQLKNIQKYYEMSTKPSGSHNGKLQNYSCYEVEPYEKNISEILKLINDRENIGETLTALTLNEDYKSQQHKLSCLVKQVLDCQRPESDAADKIWLHLMELHNMQDISLCLNEVLSRLEERQKIHASVRKNILLNSVISSRLNGNLPVAEISMKKVIEIMIETGIEKLKEDFTFIFKFLGVECNKLFKKIATSLSQRFKDMKFNMDVLACLHVALDFLLGVHMYVNMSGGNLSKIAQFVVRKCCDQVSSLSAMEEGSCVQLQVPVNSECVTDHLPASFWSMRIKKCMKDAENKNYNVVLITSRSIFPPFLCQSDDDRLSDETVLSPTYEKSTMREEEYYVYTLSHLCNKI